MTTPIRKQSNLYQSLVLNSGDAMYLSDLDGKIIEVNKQACASLGYSREELLSLSISDIDEHKTEEQVCEFFTVLKREKYCRITTHHKRKEGSTFPVEVSISLLDENGSKLVLGISRDITDHIQAKQNLASYIDTLERIHLILQDANDIEKMIGDVLNVVQEVFETDRAFLFSDTNPNENFQFSPIEIVKSEFQKISILDIEEQDYQKELFEKLNQQDKEFYTSTTLEENRYQLKSEMIAAIKNKTTTTHLLGIHQCTKIREWTKLEQKLLIEISRRLGSAINQLIFYHDLGNSEKKYKSLYDNAPLSYQSLDEEGCFIDVNPTWLNLLGYKRDEVIGNKYSSFLHPDWKEHFECNFPAFKKRGYVHDVQFKIRHKKGHFLDILFEGCIGYHPDGTFKQTYCVFQDISARKKAEEKLKVSEERYRLLMEQSPFVVEVYDLDGLQISVNKAFEELWQIPASASLFKYNILSSKEVRSSGVLEHIKRAYEGETLDLPDHEYNTQSDLNNEYKSRSRWLKSRVYPLKDELGKVTHIVVVHRDITDQKKAEAKFVESEAKFENFFQKSPIPLINMDNTTHEVKYLNTRFLELFGYTLDEISTLEKWFQLAYPDPEYRKIVVEKWGKATKLAKKNSTDILPEVYNVTCKNGDIRQVLISGIIIGNEFLAMLVDISAQKKIEEELITAKDKAEESEKLKTAFLANMSHEIRTPMNGILGFAELLQTPELSSEKYQKYVQIIMQSGNKMLSTINDIIEISKIETQQIKPKHRTVDLNEFLNSQYAFFLPETSKIDFSLKNSLLASEYEVETDLSMLDSILTNLIKNAIKFTNKGSVEFACTKKEQFIEFYVKDTGIGISKDQQKLVFERFRQISTDSTKIIEGSGLGLSIAKAYAELLGGKIWMKSKEGVGSQFWFIIPCTR
jgi:PAS domain S-box-containing protein